MITQVYHFILNYCTNTFITAFKVAGHTIYFLVTYKELLGIWRKRIEDGVCIHTLLYQFYFQAEGIDKVWRLLFNKQYMNKSRDFFFKIIHIYFWKTKN